MKKITAQIIVLFLIIVLCSVFARIFSGSETLSEYAKNNPELAYADSEEDKIAEKQAQSIPSVHTDNKTADSSEGQNDNMKAENMNTDNMKDDNMKTETASKQNTSTNPNENENPDRMEYKKGFYYEPLSENIKQRITGISYPVSEQEKTEASVNVASSLDDIQISYDDLRYLSVQYYNFKGIVRTGEIICNQAIAQDLAEIFYELYRNEYEIEQIHLIDEYSGDDTLSMQDNNTSCFNYRVVDGTATLSKHALGLAIDINPFFNPYVVYKNDGTTYISPKGSETYADRSNNFAYKIDENDLCYKLFKEHGFTWGGDWNSLKDYQHFQKSAE